VQRLRQQAGKSSLLWLRTSGPAGGYREWLLTLHWEKKHEVLTEFSAQNNFVWLKSHSPQILKRTHTHIYRNTHTSVHVWAHTHMLSEKRPVHSPLHSTVLCGWYCQQWQLDLFTRITIPPQSPEHTLTALQPTITLNPLSTVTTYTELDLAQLSCPWLCPQRNPVACSALLLARPIWAPVESGALLREHGAIWDPMSEHSLSLSLSSWSIWPSSRETVLIKTKPTFISARFYSPITVTDPNIL
jgi:hypothetical protein